MTVSEPITYSALHFNLSSKDMFVNFNINVLKRFRIKQYKALLCSKT